MIDLQLAEKYHQRPQDIENWDYLWFKRAYEFDQITAEEAIKAEKEATRDNKNG